MWPTRIQNLKYLAVAVAEILHGVQNSKTGHLTLTAPLSGKIFYQQGGTCYGKSMYQIFKSLGSPVTKLWITVQNAENGVVLGG